MAENRCGLTGLVQAGVASKADCYFNASGIKIKTFESEDN